MNSYIIKYEFISPVTYELLHMNSYVSDLYMLVPKRTNYQYWYGAAQYRYRYPYSNSLVFSFLSQFFQSTIEFTSLGSE